MGCGVVERHLEMAKPKKRFELLKGRGVGKVVTVLALFSNDPISNPAGIQFYVKMLLKRTK